MSAGEPRAGDPRVPTVTDHDYRDDPETAPMHPSVVAERMLHAFALMVECQGGRIQRARCSGYEPPGVTDGQVSNHRFDMIGSWPANSTFIVEAVPMFRHLREVQMRRWSLLMSQAARISAQIYFLVKTKTEADFLRATLLVRGVHFDVMRVIELA